MQTKAYQIGFMSSFYITKFIQADISQGQKDVTSKGPVSSEDKYYHKR